MNFIQWYNLMDLKGDFTRSALTLLVALLLISWYKWIVKPSTRKYPPLPPGPRGLPLVGNLPFLDRNLHHCFAKLAQIYGPVIKLKLGSKLCIVVTSPSVAKEVLKDHDTIFANRYVPAIGVTASYGCVDMVWSPHGEHWRMLRKICVRELLSKARLESLYGLRKREVRNMVSQVYSKVGEPIDVGEQLLLAMFNVMTNILWGGTLEGEEKERVRTEFKQVMDTSVRVMEELNVSDLFPILAPFDLQRKVQKMEKIMVWFDKIFHHVIERRHEIEREEGDLKQDEDFLQILLQLIDHGDEKTPFTVTHLKALLVDVIIAGTGTTSTTVQWAIAELMKQPELMRKVKKELEEFVGMDSIVEESHLPKLQYLNAVVKETLRIHPVTPFLVRQCPTESHVIGGYMVPKGVQIFLDVWAIQRDPKYWNNPLEFQPGRFLDSSNEWDFNGTDLRYFPFGSGKRICVGIPMAERLIPYLLASLVHSFDWELPNGEALDLSESFGILLTKTTPLTAIPIPRLFGSKPVYLIMFMNPGYFTSRFVKKIVLVRV